MLHVWARWTDFVTTYVIAKLWLHPIPNIMDNSEPTCQSYAEDHHRWIYIHTTMSCDGTSPCFIVSADKIDDHVWIVHHFHDRGWIPQTVVLRYNKGSHTCMLYESLPSTMERERQRQVQRTETNISLSPKCELKQKRERECTLYK